MIFTFRQEIVSLASAMIAICLGIVVFCTSGFAAGADRLPDGDGVEFFQKHVNPLLTKHCWQCHGAKNQKSELNLSTPAGILKGGESGQIVVPGKPEESLLYEMVHDGLMPPEDKEPLTKSDIKVIRKWIEMGAKLPAEAKTERRVTQHDIIPLLNLRCTVCHGLRRQEAGLDLRTKASMLKGGKSGPAIVLGMPEESLILKRIRAEEMPPRNRLVEVSVKTMQSQEIELLAFWIQAGAPQVNVSPDVATDKPDPLVSVKDRSFWSFQSPKAAKVPVVEPNGRAVNPIDAFVLRKLKEKGLALSPAADRRTLIRRVYFDLTGLPPEPAQVAAFLADNAPGAYERLIDRVLASPHYGERWGRYWLDLVGYSDSEGKREQDTVRPNAYRYRDYVIRALNAGKPYDRFITEQLAGDELVDYENEEVVTQQVYDNLVATGFLRMAPDDTLANITNFVPNRLGVLADEMQVFGSAVLGLTLQCCRCHSHKFDPIPQRDYYRLLSVFRGAFDQHDWLKPQPMGLFRPVRAEHQRQLSYVTTEEKQRWLEHEKQLTARISALNQALDKQRLQLIRKYSDKRLAKLPGVMHDDLQKMLSTPKAKRDAVQNYLAAKFEKTLRISTDELKKIDAGFKKQAAETAQKVKALEGQRLPEPKIRALWDRGDPSPTYILRRGNYLTPGRMVGPGVPSALTDGKTPFVVKPPWPGAKKTGRRLALAQWLTRPEHPLTARVMVNRIWQHHFERGIVQTPGNFGKAGARPTHPDLLDWLAVKFAGQDWNVKKMHRLMITSATYRQSARITPQHQRSDPENRLLSRAPMRRMEAEVVRDTLLFVAGQLDRRQFGPPDKVTVRADGLVTSVGSEQGRRRSIYVQQRRKELPTILEAFDLPQMNPNCVSRLNSIVAPQALHLLNNKTVHEQANLFAERVIAQVGHDSGRQIDRVYLIAIGRLPSAKQRAQTSQALAELTSAWAEKYSTDAGFKKPVETKKIKQQAAARALGSVCHAIMNSATFLYID